MTKNHGGELIEGAIIERRSLRMNHWKENHREEVIEESGICQASGRHPGGVWGASATPGGHGAPGSSKSQISMPLSARMQKFY